MSKIKEAMRLVYDENKNPHQAALAVGLQPSAVYRELKKEREAEAMRLAQERQECYYCGAPHGLEARVNAVLVQLDRSAAESESQVKRDICASIAKALRGG